VWPRVGRHPCAHDTELRQAIDSALAQN
jgi:hypothetical protein